MEEVYMAQCEPGWGEHTSSNLDDITEITPENIHAALTSEIPSHTPSLEKITEWLQKCRENPENPPTIELYQDDECPTCGHNPLRHYELTYYKGTTND